MKRTEIIKQLMAEGFTEKTLVNFSDRQLQSLSTRITESLTVKADTLQKDPSTKTKVDAMAKTSDIKIVPEEVKETGVPGLKAKVVKETGVPGLKAKEVKESGVPGLKAKVVKETGVPGLKAKEVKESGVPGLKAKVVKETGVPGLKAKKMDMKEDGAMPGLSLKGKSTTDPAKKVSKEKDVNETDETETNENEHLTKKELFLKKIGKLKKEKDSDDKKTIKEWVDSVADKYYHSFTSKNDIMEMIATKMKQAQTGEKLPKFLSYKGIMGGEVETAPAVPKTRPTTKPGTTPKTPPTPRKTPYRPGPGINPHPKALSENEPLEVEEGKVPVSNPGKETKPSFNPGKRVELTPKKLNFQK